MVRRLLLLSALVAFSEVVFALGLGDLELESALNQEFAAEVELTNVRNLEPQEILPGLATQEDFDRIGIERNYILTDLRFAVITNDAGNLAVRITSTRPIVEPFLNFLVEVLWPSGRILREYTVLLDPPVFGQQGIERITAPSSTPAAASTSAQPAQPAPAPQPAPAAPSRPRLEEGTRSGDEYGMTGPGDTLWKIALSVRPNDSVSVQQMMLALQRANPDAFINDNINLLKAGHVLRIPGMREIREETFASAVEKVREQNDAFAAYRGGRTATAQLDATPRRTTGSASGTGSPSDGELRLLASSDAAGERAGSGGSSEGMQRLQNQLSVAEEDLDRARRANSELNSRLSDLEDQLETLNEIVQLKDDQLAALRAEVQRMQTEQSVAPAPAAPASSSGSLLTNPLVLGVLVLILVVGAAAGLIFMRRRNQADDFDDEEFTAIAEEAEPLEEEPAEEEEPALTVEEAEEDVSPQTSDVISEAEIYIAYGRFPQAITFLQNAIESEPGRADIQLKLLEVYVQTEDATAFNLQLEQLRALGDEAALNQALELQRQIPGAAEDAAAAMDATVVSSEPVAAIEEPADDDDDLSFDLDDLDSETEDDTLELGDDIDLDGDDTVELEDADLDLDLDLEADGSDDEIELDLGDDDDEIELDLGGEDDEIELDLGDDDDALNLDEADAGDNALDLGDDEIELDLDDDDDAISLDTEDLDDMDLDAELEQAAAATADDDEIELDLGDDDSIELDLDAADDDIDLGSDDDDGIELNLDDDDDAIELNLDDDDDDALDLGGDDDLEIDLGDDDELNLDEDASTKLDLARAYIDMGDSDGARKVLEEVVNEGDDSEVQQANELLEQIS